MSARIVAGSLLATLFVAAPAAAQNVAADVLVHSGGVVGQVTVGDTYARYRRRPVVIVHRRPAARPVVVVERYAPRVVVVERLHGHRSSRAWARQGYRPVTLYYRDGRYYDYWSERWPTATVVVVYERGGRYYTADCENRDRNYENERNWDD
ncbi:MAG: hypothetical protein ACJ8DJ_21990 [Gemmatimonadales bacterium]